MDDHHYYDGQARFEAGMRETPRDAVTGREIPVTTNDPFETARWHQRNREERQHITRRREAERRAMENKESGYVSYDEYGVSTWSDRIPKADSNKSCLSSAVIMILVGILLLWIF